MKDQDREDKKEAEISLFTGGREECVRNEVKHR